MKLQMLGKTNNKIENSTHWIILDISKNLLSESEIFRASSKMNSHLPPLALRQKHQKKFRIHRFLFSF